MSRHRRRDLDRDAAASVPGPDVRVSNHDRMRRDVTVEIRREDEVVAVERASLPQGGATSWCGLIDAPGRYHVSVELSYGSSRTVEWEVEHPGTAILDVIVVPDGVDVRAT